MVIDKIFMLLHSLFVLLSNSVYNMQENKKKNLSISELKKKKKDYVSVHVVAFTPSRAGRSLEANMVYTVSSRTARATQKNSVFKKQKP